MKEFDRRGAARNIRVSRRNETSRGDIFHQSLQHVCTFPSTAHSVPGGDVNQPREDDGILTGRFPPNARTESRIPAPTPYSAGRRMLGPNFQSLTCASRRLIAPGHGTFLPGTKARLLPTAITPTSNLRRPRPGGLHRADCHPVKPLSRHETISRISCRS